MKQKFRDIKLSALNKERLNMINDIITEYQDQNYVLTLRQLYYQLVSRDVIPNDQKEYSKLSKLLKEGRMGGIVDWAAIEDRLRRPSQPASFNDPADIMDAAIQQFALPRQRGQKTYVEVWVEKDALSGVLKRITEKYHIPILVNRGYSSVSAMFDSYERFESALRRNQEIVILYLGDYDPSGIDMIRDVRDRILEFMAGSSDIMDMFESLMHKDHDIYNEFMSPYVRDQGLEEDFALEIAASDWAASKFTVTPIALTRDQIDLYNPPPNPAKIKDPRSGKFIKAHGRTSWEVDALKPEVLNQILNDAILENIDIDIYTEVVSLESDQIEKLKSLKQYL